MFEKTLGDKFFDGMDQNREIFASYMNDKDFQRIVTDWMWRQIYDEVPAQPLEGVPTADLRIASI